MLKLLKKRYMSLNCILRLKDWHLVNSNFEALYLMECLRLNLKATERSHFGLKARRETLLLVPERQVTRIREQGSFWRRKNKNLILLGQEKGRFAVKI